MNGCNISSDLIIVLQMLQFQEKLVFEDLDQSTLIALYFLCLGIAYLFSKEETSTVFHLCRPWISYEEK